MTENLQWKTIWPLKSLTHAQLFTLIQEIIAKQLHLDETKKTNLTLETNLIETFDADSVDITAMIGFVEDVFEAYSTELRKLIPSDIAGKIVTVHDFVDLMVIALTKLETVLGSTITPNTDVLSKRKKRA